jgi:cell division protein ZapA
MQDYIAMVLVWYATEQHASVAAGVEKDTITDQLRTIEKLLDSHLPE